MSSFGEIAMFIALGERAGARLLRRLDRAPATGLGGSAYMYHTRQRPASALLQNDRRDDHSALYGP